MGRRPRYGLCMPVRFLEVAGRQIHVRLISSTLLWCVRISGVSLPAPDEPGHIEAMEFVRDVLSKADEPAMELLAPTPHDMLSKAARERVAGDIWVTPDMTLGQMLLLAGHGTRRSDEPMVNPPEGD